MLEEKVFSIAKIAADLGVPTKTISGPGGRESTAYIWEDGYFAKAIEAARDFATKGGEVRFDGHEKGWFAAAIACEFLKAGCYIYSDIHGNKAPMLPFKIGEVPADQGLKFEVLQKNFDVFLNVILEKDPGPISLAVDTIAPSLTDGQKLYVKYKGHGPMAIGAVLAYHDQFEDIFVIYDESRYICVVSNGTIPVGTLVQNPLARSTAR